MKNNNDYLPALTGVRAIAAYMVFIHHYQPLPEKIIGKYSFNFLNEFHVGVTFFFVLSGFLIAYRYFDAKIDFKKYIVNRIARIYPIYFFLTSLTFLAFIYSDHSHIGKDILLYFLNISFAKGLFSDYKFSGIAQGWSLTVEEMFYITAPMIFLLIKKNKSFFFILPILLILIGFLLTAFFSNYKFYSFMSNNEFMLNYTFFGRCTEFLIGIGLALFIKKSTTDLSRFSFTYIGLFLLIISIFCLSLLKGNSDFGIRHPLGKLINTFILPITGIAVFYYGLIKETTLISRFLASKPMMMLGKSSYIFYLIHIGLIQGILNKFTYNSMIIFVVINIISIILFHYVEKPLNDFIRNKFSPVRGKTIAYESQ